MKLKEIVTTVAIATFVLTGCDKVEENQGISKPTPPIESVEVSGDVESLALYHDENNPGDFMDGAGFFKFYVITEDVVGIRLIFDNPTLDTSNSTFSKSTIGEPIAPDNLHEQPLSGADGFVTDAPKPKEDLTKDDFVVVSCFVAYADDSEVACTNTVAIENLLNYNYGPVYLIEKEGGYQFSLTKE